MASTLPPVNDTITDRAPGVVLEQALRRVMAEIHEGLRHGFFEYVLTCEIVGQNRRKLTLKAGKSYQFVITRDECEPSPPLSRDSSHWSASDECD